jgi:hypothetical protein
VSVSNAGACLPAVVDPSGELTLEGAVTVCCRG